VAASRNRPAPSADGAGLTRSGTVPVWLLKLTAVAVMSDNETLGKGVADGFSQELKAKGGQVVVRRAPTASKDELDIFGPPPPGFALMRELKRTLDPNAILNPGRFVGGI